MTRVQILLEDREVKVLRRQAKSSQKSCSQLVREAIDLAYLPRFREEEIAGLARDARLGRGTRTFNDANSFLKHLWGL